MVAPQAGDKVDPTESAAGQYQSPREAKSLLKKRKDRLEKSNKMSKISNRNIKGESLHAITEASKDGSSELGFTNSQVYNPANGPGYVDLDDSFEGGTIDLSDGETDEE